MLQAKLFIICNQAFMQTDARVEGSNIKARERLFSSAVRGEESLSSVDAWLKRAY